MNESLFEWKAAAGGERGRKQGGGVGEETDRRVNRLSTKRGQTRVTPADLAHYARCDVSLQPGSVFPQVLKSVELGPRVWAGVKCGLLLYKLQLHVVRVHAVKCNCFKISQADTRTH